MVKRIVIGILSLFVVGSLAACSKNVEVVLPNGETSKVEVENDTPVIDPFENYEMKFSGYEGYGKAEFTLKDGADKNDMLTFKVEDYSNLKNGDVLKVTVEYSDKYKSALLYNQDEKLEEFVFTPAYKEYVVSDLEALKEIDPFEGLKLEFDGISPYANVSFNTADCGEFVNENFAFSLTEVKGHKNGESVTVKAYYNDSISLGEKGYILSRETCEYTVECASEFINVKSEVDFTELNQNMDDIVEANANSWVGKSNIFGIFYTEFEDYFSTYANIKSIDSVELCGSYLMSLKTPKSSLSDKTYNKYCNIYCVTFTIGDEKYGDTPNCKVYAAYTIDDISTDASGVLLYNNGQDFDPDMVYADAAVLLNSLESTHVIANKGDYNVLEIEK